MIQSLDPARVSFLADLDVLQQRITNDQIQLSSGFRINTAADSPSQDGDVVQLSSDVARAQQVQTNLQSYLGSVGTAQTTLQSAVSLLESIRSEGAQGASSTVDASTRSTLATQVEQQLSQLVDLSRATFAGNYIFSGDNQTAPQYQLDPTSPTGVDRNFQTQVSTEAQDINGITFVTGLTAQDIFDHRNADDSIASDNVFAAVNNLQQALAANDTTAINSALTALQPAADYLNQQLAFYGDVENRLNSSVTAAQQVQVQWQASLSQVRDADIAAVSTDMTSAETNQQAALAAEGQFPRETLFSFLT